MLHILNGDRAADLLAKTKLAGEILSWQEALAIGPNPACACDNERREQRARYLSKAYQRGLKSAKNALFLQEQKLATLSNHEAVVLWFDQDLLCQINLLFLLNWFSGRKPKGVDLYLLCVTECAGVENFKGFGQLSPKQLESLFEKREKVSTEILEFARDGWLAFTAPDPGPLQSLLANDTYALPLLTTALQAHLERLPSARNGLGRIQGLLLNLMAGGIDEFVPLSQMVNELEPIYGLDDHQIWNELVYLTQVSNPLLTIHNINLTGTALPKPALLEKAFFKLTSTGKAICVGNSDMLNLNRVDYWLGGIHINDETPVWRWDDERQDVVASE